MKPANRALLNSIYRLAGWPGTRLPGRADFDRVRALGVPSHDENGVAFPEAVRSRAAGRLAGTWEPAEDPEDLPSAP